MVNQWIVHITKFAKEHNVQLAGENYIKKKSNAEKTKVKKPDSDWVVHVKKFAKDNNMPYGCAISLAKETYEKPKLSKADIAEKLNNTEMYNKMTEKMKSQETNDVEMYNRMIKKTQLNGYTINTKRVKSITDGWDRGIKAKSKVKSITNGWNREIRAKSKV